MDVPLPGRNLIRPRPLWLVSRNDHSGRKLYIHLSKSSTVADSFKIPLHSISPHSAATERQSATRNEFFMS